MYPKLSDIINDLFGTNINLPVQSYGFFLAMAFLVAALILYKELDRKEKEGLINPLSKRIWKDKPVSAIELLISFAVAFIIGFKVVEAFLDYSFFANKPQEFLLSGKGNVWGGVVSALAYAFYVYYSSKLKKSSEPHEIEITVHARDHTWPIVFVAVVFGIIGAKLFHWFENWDAFMADPMGSLLSFAGLTFYGGLIVAAFAVVAYTSKNGIYWRHIADIVAPALIIAYGIGRIGCQTAGDGDWGITNNMPKPQWLSFLPDWLWAFDYPHNIINEGVPIPGCIGQHCMQLAMPVFPTPLYETAMALIIFLILWSLRKRLRVPGMLFSIYLMFNGLERFLIEKIRVNNLFGFMGMKVTQAEVISTLIFITGLVFFVVFALNDKKAKS
ncbi:MAG: prolipoprotein diacylglyceryl transferase [Chlorobi bacterium]|nr:prolipoprotein diacylglyceryl transferase [Chlorobiota bacterium]